MSALRFTLRLDVATQVVELTSDSPEAVDWLAADSTRAALIHGVANEVLARNPKLEISDRALTVLAAWIAAGIRGIFPEETFEIRTRPPEPGELVWRDTSPFPVGYRK